MARQDDNGSEFFARCAAGFEPVLARELKGLGARRVRPLKGGVAFFGQLVDAYRVCLWSRVATRIQLVLARLDARDADALYAGAVRMPWEEHVAEGATIAVQAHGTNDALRNTQFTALKLKDAICDRLRDRCGTRPDVDPRDPDFEVDASVHENHATLFLNLSGPSLHRRGYREQSVQTEAPLKETLAAGILLAAGWDALAGAGASFADPMCGSGTLAIEAALIASGAAPGLLRTRWGFTGWKPHDGALWSALVDEARLQAGGAYAGSIIAGDLDADAVSIARANAERAGAAQLIRFSVADAADLGRRLEALPGGMPACGLVAVNPPYGHRLQTPEQLSSTYAALSSGLAALPSGWRMAAITPDAGIDTALGSRADRTIACYNGPLRASVRLYDAVPSQRRRIEVVSLAGKRCEVAVAEQNSAQFAARLRKVAKERAKWARKAGVSCYRIYDADLPEYALSVDVFTSVDGGLFARIEEHPAPASIDADRADIRFADACALARAVLDLEPPRVAALSRKREEHEPLVVSVREGGHVFEANLAALQDTGLPLDHRATRELLAGLADGARFLSLGSYAGAPAVYAAAGGAREVTVVDPASSYLAWAERNLGANGVRARTERAEIAGWLARAPRYDLIYVDASALPGQEMLLQAARSLTSDGRLVLTARSRTFKLDEGALEAAGFAVEDVTARTIPHDFARTPKIHRCWLISRA